MTDAESPLEEHFAKYEPAIAGLGRALRARLRARLPGLFEVVYLYERQHALLISYSPTERGYEGVCSIALYPDRAQLGFPRGALLSKSDPTGLLQGRGPGVRHVVLHSVEEFDRPEIEALIAASLKLAKVNVDAGAKGAVVDRAESQKRRARRAKRAVRPASPRRKG